MLVRKTHQFLGANGLRVSVSSAWGVVNVGYDCHSKGGFAAFVPCRTLKRGCHLFGNCGYLPASQQKVPASRLATDTLLPPLSLWGLRSRVLARHP